MAPRFYVAAGLAAGATIELPPEAAHHAVRVLRLVEGDEVVLFDGRGGEWHAHLQRSGPVMRAALHAFDADDREAPIRVTLVQGLPSADKMDWIIQKCTELGVARIQPVAARRSVVRLSGERMVRRGQHWQQVAVAACEQCGRNRVPEVAALVDLPHYLGMTAPESETRLLLTPGAESSLSQLEKPAGGVTLMIGPEGGYEDGEVRAALAAGFTPVSLGPRVLRTETAGAAMLAALMARWGDF